MVVGIIPNSRCSPKARLVATRPQGLGLRTQDLEREKPQAQEERESVLSFAGCGFVSPEVIHVAQPS
jgi:hypothetical protein